MFNDVDLSSKKWLDIVFEGKNKDFGAYKMRSDSPRRHTKAVIIVLIILAIAIALIVLSSIGVFEKAESEGPDATVEQTVVDYTEPEEEEEEEMENIPEPEEVIELPQEEVANQMANTLWTIEDDDKVIEEVHSQDEMLEDDRAIGSQDISDGVDDFTKELVTEQVVVVEQPKEEDVVYTVANVQQKPEFPGGEAELYKWLGKNIVYPAQAQEENVQGKVTVQFEVGKDGRIGNIKVVRGKHPALDKEAVRVVGAMPNWNPGRNNGQAVKVTYTLPITFKLESSR